MAGRRDTSLLNGLRPNADVLSANDDATGQFSSTWVEASVAGVELDGRKETVAVTRDVGRRSGAHLLLDPNLPAERALAGALHSGGDHHVSGMWVPGQRLQMELHVWQPRTTCVGVRGRAQRASRSHSNSDAE